ncbi:MAG: hypothetical protein QG593_267 [Patescibacteria group bacterium]|jgi:hypothetical protein|nr:hypothetical protein [Patescibacteria group bacterium]
MNSSLTRDLLAVIKDLEYERDSSVNDRGLLYRPKERRTLLQRTGIDLDYDEQLRLFLKLAELGVIKIEHLPQTDEILLEVGIPSTSFKFEIIEPQFTQLSEDYSKLDAKPHSGSELITCRLRLKDVQLLLKIGECDEMQIASLHEDRDPHNLFKKLLNSPDTSFGRLEIFENGSVENLWQIVSKSHLAYLSPFFERSKDRMLIHAQVDLDSAHIISILSNINEKYRKNFGAILASLQNK